MASQQTPPLTVAFYDLMDTQDHFIKDTATEDFLQFVQNQQVCMKKLAQAESESQRLQMQVESSQSELSCQGRKIQEIRRHLEGKMELVNKLEIDKEKLELRNQSARSLVISYLGDSRLGSDVKDRFRNVLAVLESGDKKMANILKSPGGALDTISEAETTDLSMTQSEDDLDLSVRRSRRRRSKRTAVEQTIPVKRSRRSEKRGTESTPDQLVAKTVVSFPKDGPIHAVASLETRPSNNTKERPEAEILLKPSAPPISTTSESESDAGWKVENHSPVSQNPGLSPRFGRTLSSGGAMAMRSHAFCPKTIMTTDTCGPCGKRIKFSKIALKCRDCKATCHPNCKDDVPLPCVKVGTPSNKNQMGTIADYVPNTHPMVPSLIQHCVNEVEVRGLNTVGLYRVPGPEKEVKDLKEKFLRGKGVPSLGRYDIFSVCGCLKDFLRSLQEPLIGRWFWRDFDIASQMSDPIKRRSEFERIISDLPPPNQDTLAFVILHLLRVSESPEVKMSISNLSKIFGPTIVGYSGPDIDAQGMIRETKKQQVIVETLLTMPSGFWQKLLYRPTEQGKLYGSSGTYTRSKARSVISASTPLAPPPISALESNGVSSTGKRIYFTDDSPKDIKERKRRSRRNFFD